MHLSDKDYWQTGMCKIFKRLSGEAAEKAARMAAAEHQQAAADKAAA